jgi:hypothetical protein
MFSQAVLNAAGHTIFAMKVADEFERWGGSFHPGCELYGAIEPLAFDPCAEKIIRKIGEAIGAPVNEVFLAGGIEQDDATLADALGDLMMGVLGHGVSILDDYADEWRAGLQATGAKDQLPYDEMSCYDDLAYNALTLAGYAENDTERGVITIAYEWHGGQESMLYAFASTQTVQHENHRAGILREIESSLTYAREKQPEDVAELEKLLAAVKNAKIGQKFLNLY